MKWILVLPLIFACPSITNAQDSRKFNSEYEAKNACMAYARIQDRKLENNQDYNLFFPNKAECLSEGSNYYVTRITKSEVYKDIGMTTFEECQNIRDYATLEDPSSTFQCANKKSTNKMNSFLDRQTLIEMAISEAKFVEKGLIEHYVIWKNSRENYYFNY
tara:strand:+ start:307 stop:789 length:483 start_codon:yes stop_codon:yes gene_type:complete